MSEANPTALQPGTIIDGKFEIESVLGEGGFGVVFRARQLTTGQPVAVKMLHTQHIKGSTMAAKAAERFEREMQVIARLKHPHIVRLFDTGRTEDGTLYAAIEFVVGKPLSEVIKTEGCLKPAEAVRLMGQVIDALAAAHDAGVVHRDMKPDNIMLTSTGARRNALVLDFGIAGLSDQPEGVDIKKLTATGQFIGTPHYMAPEQLSGHKTTPQTDIYAWGLVFVEALTGKTPIDAGSLAGILMKQMSPEPVPIPDAVAQSPLGAVLRKAVEKDLARRHATAKDALVDLEAVNVAELSDFPILNTSDSHVFCETDAGDIAVLAAAVDTSEGETPRVAHGNGKLEHLEPAAVIPPTAQGAAPHAHADDEPEPTPKGSRGLVLLVAVLGLLILLGGGVLILELRDLGSETTSAPAPAPTAAPPDAAAAPLPDVVTSPGTAATPETAPVLDASEPIAPRFAQGQRLRPQGTRGPEMVFHAGGAYPMGLSDEDASLAASACRSVAPEASCGGDGFANQKPAHDVVVDPFFIDRTEVSAADYRACVSAGACPQASFDQCAVLVPDGSFAAVKLAPKALEEFVRNVAADAVPAVCATRDDAAAFCAWAGKRLPTEAEWEYAATAGGTTFFPWGDEADPSRTNGADGVLRGSMPKKAWRTPPIPLSSAEDGFAFAAPVESLPSGASPLGVLQLAGNVREWVEDGFALYGTGAAREQSRTGVARGGGWADAGPWLSGTVRFPLDSAARRSDTGFRCALSAAAVAE